MENINVFAYSKLKLMNEKPSKIITWINILLLSLILFIILSIFLKYNIYSTHIGYIEITDNYNLKVIVDNTSLPIKKNYKLYIDNKQYNYKIIKIDKLSGYSEILISAKLDNKVLINNNIVTVRFKKNKTTIMNELIKKIKKGMV